MERHPLSTRRGHPGTDVASTSPGRHRRAGRAHSRARPGVRLLGMGTAWSLLCLGLIPVLAHELRAGEATPTVVDPPARAAGQSAPVGPQTSQAAVPLGDGTMLAAWKLVDGVKEFELVLAPRKHETEPGRVKDGLSVNGSIPGPTIRVNEGDKLRITVDNKMKEGTAIHWHGMDLPNEMDGVPGITQPTIRPGAKFVYEWAAISPGSHWYHSHMHGDQEGRGVFGSLEIVPRVGDIAADRDYRMIFSDGALGFTINGKSFPDTTRVPARVGERIRIRLIGAGPEMIHSVHLHLGFFEVVAQDGNRLPQPYRADTVLLGVGQTYDLIWVPTRTGAWMFHCHIFSHSETKNGMTGMVTLFDVSDANGLTAPKLPGIAAPIGHRERRHS